MSIPSPAIADSPPNILMVLADQHNAEWLGCAGHPQVLTPRLDAFASTGVRFTSAYAQNTVCTPSRVSILSGQYAHNHGHYGLSGNRNPGLPSLFGHLRDRGYRTAGYGKLHLPCEPLTWASDHADEFADAYDSNDGVVGEGEFLKQLEAKGLRHLEDSWHNTEHYTSKSIPIDGAPSELPLEETQEMWCVRRAMDFMSRGDDRPFMIQVSFQKPHHPVLPNPRFWEQYAADLDMPPDWDRRPDHRPPHFRQQWEDWRDYPFEFRGPGDGFADCVRRSWRGTLACVTQVDHVFGVLLDFLDEAGLADNTIVIYGSDHGGYHGTHGLLEKAPGICSEAVCRVPMIWRVPGVTAAGADCDRLVENVDYAPTFCALAGVDPMPSADGEDLSTLLRTPEAEGPRDVAVTENVWSRAVRWKDWRLVVYPRRMFGEDVGELYHLADDPHERRNLYAEPDYLPVVNEGRARLLDWLVTHTRIVTPPNHRNRRPNRTVDLAADGRAANAWMPAHRDDMLINYL
ncbi:MAG: sulfatase-like hydrolase/transferase [Planctomycetota bacterium]